MIRRRVQYQRYALKRNPFERSKTNH